METMSYSKLRKKGSNAGLIAFLLFIVLGSAIITYSLINEPKPVIIGRDPLANAVPTSGDNVKEVSQNEDNISYKVVDKVINETNGNFKASITIPTFQIDSVNIASITDTIVGLYTTRYEAFKQEMAGTVENKFTYKVSYNQYENIVNGEKIVSLTIYEKMVDDKSNQNTMERLDTYNINVKTKEIITQDVLASGIIGTNYSNLIKDQIKQTVIGAKMIAEDAYKYNVTGLEKCYVKEGGFHIILNPGEVVEKKYSIIDILITK